MSDQTLRPGEKLGPYEIIGPIGEGGMGQVYRAADARLGRSVAIKVLPASFAADPERLHRFELEARAAGQLNHPNVLTVFDVGTHSNGPYLVTELLEGETLRERLTPAAGSAGTTAIATRKAVDIARQTALGLAAAHAAGIVHRDLKPENIFLTADGRVKILDFGLARMTEREQNDRTTLQVTSPGTVLGTVGYMSPEQVRGLAADARSDLFALGAVLFELLSGRRAFARDNSADTLAAILKEDPPDLPASGVGVSPALDRIVRRCLEKSPDERFQSARDLAFALEAVDNASSGSQMSLAGAAPTRGSRAPVGVLIAAGAVAVAAAGYFAGRWTAPDAGTASVAELRQLTFGGSDLRMPAMSPDGQSVAFVDNTTGDDEIYLQRAGGENPINLTRSPGFDGQHAFSPDGRQIAFRSNRDGGGIFVMGATGESVRRVTAEGFNPTWSPDGAELMYSMEGIVVPTGRSPKAALWRVTVATGQKTKVYDGDAVQPAWSPDGRRVVFWGLSGGSGQRAIYTMPVAGGEPTMLVDDSAMNWNAVWSRDGRFIYFLSDREPPMGIWRIPIDAATGAARGAPERVTLSTTRVTWLSQESAEGFTFAASDTITRIERRPVDVATMTAGRVSTILTTTRSISAGGGGRISPDGQWMVLTISDATEDLVVMRTDGTSMVRLTNDAARDRMAGWVGDSSMVYFASDRSGAYEIWRIRRDGGGLEQWTRGTDANLFGDPLPSPDGRRLAAITLQPTPIAGLIDDLQGPVEQRKFRSVGPPEIPVSFRPMGWLPDGRVVGQALTAGKDAAIVLYDPATRTGTVIPTPDLTPQALILDRLVVSAAPDGGTRIVDLQTRTVRAAPANDLGPGLVDLMIAPDGRALYTVRETTVTNLWMITGSQKAEVRSQK